MDFFDEEVTRINEGFGDLVKSIKDLHHGIKKMNAWDKWLNDGNNRNKFIKFINSPKVKNALSAAKSITGAPNTNFDFFINSFTVNSNNTAAYNFVCVTKFNQDNKNKIDEYIKQNNLTAEYFSKNHFKMVAMHSERNNTLSVFIDVDYKNI